ncbi:hypothetical protein EG68_03835 [Paragonimus skrjabini miyazakii]|uniref:Uncharacterized protein n=1 Tax=Paragonimus skrjabini miyazakii TaxID=59628 RepID=A0A8S9Z0F3_9TREM|nr:hypothetical protein EG68_03835 [Paragonimus skrjabini miyazakii]
MPKYCVQLVADVLTLPSRDTSEYSDINEDHPTSIEKVVELERTITCPLLTCNPQLTKSDGSIHNCAENYLELPNSVGTSQQSFDQFGERQNLVAKANAHVFPMGNTACCMPDGIRQTWNNSAATDATSSVQCFAPNLLPVHRTFVISRAVQCNDSHTNEPTMFNNHSYHEPNVVSRRPACIRNNHFTRELQTAKTNVVPPFPEDEPCSKAVDDSTGGLNVTSNRINNLITSTSELSVDVSSLSVQKYPNVTSSMKSPVYGPTQSTELLQEHLRTSPVLQEEDIDSLSATMSVVSSKGGRESLKKFKQRPAPYAKRKRTSTPDERLKSIMHNTLQDWQTKPDKSANKLCSLLDLSGFEDGLFSRSGTHVERKVKMDIGISKNIQNSREKWFFGNNQKTTCSDAKKASKQIFSFGDVNSDGTSDTLSDTSSVSSLEPSKLIQVNKNEMNSIRKKATTINCGQKITVDGNCSLKYPTESCKTTTLNQPNYPLHQSEGMLSSLNKQMNPNPVTSVESSANFAGKKTQVEEKNVKIDHELTDGSKQENLSKKGDNTDRNCNLPPAPAFPTVRMTSKSRAFSESRLPTPLGRNFSPAYRPIVISHPVSPEEKLMVGRGLEVSNNKDVSKNADEESILGNFPPNKVENKVRVNSKNDVLQKEIVQSTCDSHIKQSAVDEIKVFTGLPQCRRSRSKHHLEIVAEEKPKSQQPRTTKVITSSSRSRLYHTERPPSCLPLSDTPVTKTMKTLDNAGRFCETQSTDLKPKSSGAAYNGSLDHTESKSTKNTESKNYHLQQSTGNQNNCSLKANCSRSLLASPPARLPIRRQHSNESIVSAPLHSYSPCTQPRTKLLRRKFYIPESANIEAILSDPDDRRIKAICERYKCDVEIYSKLPWCGFLQYIVVLAARDSSTLRRCARTLDCRLNWCLNAQMR